MGKFGNKSLPKFMQEEEVIGEGSERIQELQEGHSAPEIISLGDADGGDFLTITIKTVEGEEVALEFKLDDEKEETEEEGIYKGTLTAEHNDVVYTIHCEIEEAGNGDYDIKIGDVAAEGEPAEKEEETEDVDESKVLRFEDFMNERFDIGHEFEIGSDENDIKGHSHLKRGDRVKITKKWKNAVGDVYGTDRSEDDYGLYADDIDHLSRKDEGMNCSEDAKMAIKSICEEYLCKEGMEFDQNENEEHTYEGYAKACMEYLKECMMEAWNK